jgi:hypothetical protein
MDAKIIDVDGEWVQGMAPLGFVDFSTGIKFEYRVPVKVKLSAFALGQKEAGTLASCEDPTEVLAEVAPVVVEPTDAEKATYSAITEEATPKKKK